MKPTCLGLIGLGVVGRRMAGQSIRAGVRKIVGYSKHRAEVVEAAKKGLIAEVVTSPKQVARLADLVVIDGGVSETITLLREVASTLIDRNAYCTDLSPVKEPVMEAAAGLGLHDRFAGSNALAGCDGGGSANTGANLFREGVVYVIPVGPAQTAANEVADFWQRVQGVEPVICDAESHDRLVGWTSHLPHAVAAALAVTLAKHGPRGVTYDPDTLATTEAAAGDVDAWADNLLHNRARVIDAIGEAESGLQRLKQALVAGDSVAVRGWLQEGHRWRVEVGK
jgi:prephenate dehydrogenase